MPPSRSRSCSSVSLRTRSLSGFMCSSMLSRTSKRGIVSSSTDPVPCSLTNAVVTLKAARRHTDVPAAACCPWPGFRSSYVRLPGATLRGRGRARCGAWPRRRWASDSDCVSLGSSVEKNHPRRMSEAEPVGDWCGTKTQDAEGNVAILWLFCRTFPVQLDPFIAILYAAAGTRERG
jgi:hypothetical protein